MAGAGIRMLDGARGSPMSEESAGKKVWQTVEALNRAWTVDRDVEKLRGFFHRDMVAITPMDHDRLHGRDACVASWKRFLDAAHTIRWVEREPEVALFGGGKLAVVTYYYDISFVLTATGREVHESGRDMFILVEEDGRWWVVADQFSRFPKT